MIINDDCLNALKDIPDNSIDLVFTDPPFGINEGSFQQSVHSARDGSFVIDDYNEAPQDYATFSRQWISQLPHVMKPGASGYIVSGWSQLRHIENALAETDLLPINHIIWQYNFGVHTRNKFVSSHYHILMFQKKGQRTFHRFAESDDTKESYHHRQDVWFIKKEYKPQQPKTANSLPVALPTKAIKYSSNEGDTVLDPFCGSGTTLLAAQQLNRKYIGIELSKEYCELAEKRIQKEQVK